MMRVLRYLLLITLITSVFQIGAPEISLNEIILAALVIILIGFSFLSITLYPRFPRVLGLWFSFAILVIVNVLIAYANGVTIFEWARRTLPILAWPAAAFVTFMVIRQEREIDAWRFYRLIIWILSIPIIYLAGRMLMEVGSLVASPDPILAVRMLTPWHEGVGHFAALVLVLLIPFWGRKFWVLPLSICSSIVLLISGVRTLWVGTFAVSALLLAMRVLVRRGKLQKQNLRFFPSVKIISIIAIGIVIMFMMVSPLAALAEAILSRIAIIAHFRVSPSFIERINEMSAIMASLMADPLSLLVGKGAGASFLFFSVIEGNWLQRTFSHNFYLQLWWRYGFLGLILWMVSFFAILRLSWSKRDLPPLSQAMLLGIMIAFMVSAVVANLAVFYDIFRWYVLFGILTGFTVAICYPAEKGESNQ